MVRKFLDFASCLEQWQDNDNDGDANDDDNCDDYDDGDDGDDDLPSIAQKNCLHFSICACHPCAGANPTGEQQNFAKLNSTCKS